MKLSKTKIFFNNYLKQFSKIVIKTVLEVNLDIMKIEDIGK